MDSILTIRLVSQFPVPPLNPSHGPRTTRAENRTASTKNLKVPPFLILLCFSLVLENVKINSCVWLFKVGRLRGLYRRVSPSIYELELVNKKTLIQCQLYILTANVASGHEMTLSFACSIYLFPSHIRRI